jgi:transcriptional regulator with XRE-family HTH domain
MRPMKPLTASKAERTRARKTIQRAMFERGVSFRDMAKAVGCARGSLYNVASGGVASAPTRKKIEAFLGVKIWNESTHS